MSFTSAVRGALVAFVALAACRSGQRADTAAPSSGRFAVTERAETAATTAIAVRPPFVWVAGGAGLRRYELGETAAEDVAPASHPGARGVTAIAIDDDGGAWVAAAGEVGRWVDAGDEFRYERKGTPGRVTALVPRRPTASEGIWAAGPGGLFRYDGRIFNSVDALYEVAVTSLALDDDGKGVWAGTRGRGLYRADGDRAAPVPGNDGLILDDFVGVVKTAAGTRIAAGNVAAGARLFALTAAGAVEGYRAPAGVRAIAMVQRGGDAVLIAAGTSGDAQAYTLRPLAPAENFPAGSLRFSSLIAERAARWAGIPTGDKLPPDVKVAAAGGDELVVGSAHLGAVRIGGGAAGPRFIPGSQLVGDASRLFLACVSRARCYAITGGPRAWLTDGDRYEETRVGEPAESVPLALTSDAQGGVYAIAAEPPPGGLAIMKYAAAGAGGKPDWLNLHKVALELPAKTTARVTFAAISPANTLWVGLRAASADGGEVGIGAIEIELGNGHTVQHGPAGKGKRAAEALPLPASLTDILFDSGATYYASLAGVSRWQEGQFRSWNENEGLASELVHAIARGPDSAIWAATSAGLVRFDGKDWRPLGTTELSVRGLAIDGKSRAWLATSKGLRVLTGASDPAASAVIVAGDMRDVVADRFGRVWAMSTTSIAYVDEK